MADLLGLVVARLKTISSPDLSARVAGIVELAEAARNGVSPAPYAYVLMLEETPTGNEMITQVHQRVVGRFGVVLAVPNTVTALGTVGGTTESSLKTLRDAVVVKLLGWSPDANYGPVEFGGGRMVQVKGGLLWWQDDFVTDYYLRST